MATTQNTPITATQWFALSPEEQAAAIDAEAAKRAEWLATDPGTPLATEVLAVVEYARASFLAQAAALGLTVVDPNAPKKSTGRKSSTRSGKDPWDADYAAQFIADWDGKDAKYDVIRALRDTMSVNIDEFTELWDER